MKLKFSFEDKGHKQYDDDNDRKKGEEYTKEDNDKNRRRKRRLPSKGTSDKDNDEERGITWIKL